MTLDNFIAPTGTYDLVNGNGSLIFGGILNLAFSGGSYADGTDVLQLFANTGDVQPPKPLEELPEVLNG